MKRPAIGILSMQRVINYGSFLQAYALRELLKINGAGRVFFIDIIPGKILVNESDVLQNKNVRYLRKLWTLAQKGDIISGIKTFLYNRRLEKSIITSWSMLDLDSHPDSPLDMMIIGSDEVFNCTQDVYWGYTTQLFGDIPQQVALKISSYAGSFGYTTLDRLRQFGIDNEVATNLKKLVSISVRDDNSVDIVEVLTGKRPMLHVDPVLAYGYTHEIDGFKDNPSSEPYMVVYSYQGRINSPCEIEAIKDYAKTHGLKLFSIFCRYDWCDKAILPDTPIDVLRWFKFAECIVTDTFHGTIFSIITKSKFATLIRPANRNKLHSLLDDLNLSDHEAMPSTLSVVLSATPDYRKCYSILTQKRLETNNYLRKLIDQCI